VSRYENAPTLAGSRRASGYRTKPRSNNSTLRGLLRRLDDELVVVELAAWAAYHSDPLPKEDKDGTLLAIRRMEAIRGAVNARL
jgi:hypothetical protein